MKALGLIPQELERGIVKRCVGLAASSELHVQNRLKTSDLTIIDNYPIHHPPMA
jgi:hypothetical protein